MWCNDYEIKKLKNASSLHNTRQSCLGYISQEFDNITAECYHNVSAKENYHSCLSFGFEPEICIADTGA